MRWLKECSPCGVEPDDGGTWSLKGVTTCGSTGSIPSNFGCAIGAKAAGSLVRAATIADHFGESSPSGVTFGVQQHSALQPAMDRYQPHSV